MSEIRWRAVLKGNELGGATYVRDDLSNFEEQVELIAKHLKECLTEYVKALRKEEKKKTKV